MSNATAQTIERLVNRVAELEKALDQIVNGVLIDNLNHDDNGLRILAERSNNAYICKELKNLDAIAKSALNARYVI